MRAAARMLVTVVLLAATPAVPLAAQSAVAVRAGMLRDRSTVPLATLEATRSGTRDAAAGGVDLATSLSRAYDRRGHAPIWLRQDAITDEARAMLHAISGVAARGLDPEHYDSASLATLVASGLTTAEERAAFDALLSAATLRLLHELRTGRVAASDAHLTLSLAPDSTDLAAVLLAIAGSTAPETLLDAQEPPHAAYHLLKQALAGYRDRASLDAASQAQASRIVLAMERWRWLPRRFAAPPIFINIPAYRLEAWRTSEDASDALVMDVVVGDALRHRTPVLADSVRFIEFAPYWNVPSSIANEELVPVGMRDPYLLTLNHYQILGARGRLLPMTRASVQAVSAGRASIRQLPGGTNSLGRVKFLFPNRFDVYLHDTPVQSGFARIRRDLSHGCIRLADPEALARLVLRGVAGWDSTAVRRAMAGRTPTRVDLAAPVPVYLLYVTAEARADGSVAFHDDIYGYDDELRGLMVRGRAHGPPAVIATAPDGSGAETVGTGHPAGGLPPGHR
ncbi:MAG: L,D-transpeptidase family protein [Gemmatimonadaceae bacterium]|nr:L,D-transpeptidase family protein [Gemmatimonadaceae bacterium]